MTYKEESYILDSITNVNAKLDSLAEKVEENNIMLQQIIQVFRYYLSNAKKENEDDFGRNILANLIGNIFEINKR